MVSCSARKSRGVTAKSVSSKKTIAARTSSSGVGRASRTGLVCHSRLISSRSRRRSSRSSERVRRGSSNRSSSRYSRRCATSTVRRRASVGCAVRTGMRRIRRASARTSSRDMPSRRSRRMAAPMPSASGTRRFDRSRFRSVRTRCFSSARLMSRKYAVNARATARSSAAERSSSAWSARSIVSSGPALRPRMAALRRSSTSSKSSGPSCSTITWPSRAPRSFTSRASGSLALALPMLRGSARRADSPASREGRVTGGRIGGSAADGDPSGRVVRALGAIHDAASRIPISSSGEVPPAAVVPLLEATATGHAGHGRQAPVADREHREIATRQRGRFDDLHGVERRRAPGRGQRRIGSGWVAAWL